MNELLTVEGLKKRDSINEYTTARRYVVRDNLYHNFRYRAGSYKARKAEIHPFLMTAKRGLSVLRLYDNGSHQPTKNQEAALKGKCLGWRIKEQELKRLAKIKLR